MRILFIQYGLNPFGGGVQRVTHTLAEQFGNRGHITYCAHLSNEDAYPGQPYSATISLSSSSLQDLTTFIIDNGIEIVINQCGTDVSITKRFAAAKDSCRFALISCIHISPLASREVLCYRDWRLPKIAIRSILKECLIRLYPFDRYNLRTTFDLSDKIVLLSSRFINDYLNLAKVPNNDRVTAIPNPASYPPLKDVNFDSKAQTFLVVARMGDSPKRLLRVLDTWKILQDILPEWDLKLVGDGDNLNDYKRIASRSKLQRITFTGIQQPLPYYDKASIFLMTSASEGFGMTLLEAMQRGCVPVAMDSYKAIHDLIKHRFNGLLVENGNLKAFADACVQLATSPALRKQMALNGIEHTRKFSVSAIANQWDILLNSLNDCQKSTIHH